MDDEILAEHQIIYNVQYSYMIALDALGVEFSPLYKAKIEGKITGEYNSGKVYQIPPYIIIEKMLRRWKRC